MATKPTSKKINIGKAKPKSEANRTGVEHPVAPEANPKFDQEQAYASIMKELDYQRTLLIQLLEKQIGDKTSSYDQNWLRKFVADNK